MKIHAKSVPPPLKETHFHVFFTVVIALLLVFFLGLMMTLYNEVSQLNHVIHILNSLDELSIQK